jgi:hypothetical protein
MFFQLLYIHLFRPFLKYSQATSPLPPNISPRRLCTQAATAISKLLRLYKRSHGLRQICNIAVYIANSACTLHLLNLPDRNARRDITHGVKHLEEIAESWLCARRTLAILSVLSRQWKVELPEEAAAVFTRTDAKYAAWNQDIQARDPSRPGSISPASNALPLGQIIQPPSTFFSSLSTVPMAGGPQAEGHISTPDTLPPQTAAEMRAHMAQGGDTPATMTPPAASRQSYDSASVTQAGGSPSALFGGVEQLLRESQDWWVKDQNQLAVGFDQWPREMDWLNAASTSGGSVSQPGTYAAEMPLSNLFSGINGSFSTGGMNYPNESEWYQ